MRVLLGAGAAMAVLVGLAVCQAKLRARWEARMLAEYAVEAKAVGGPAGLDADRRYYWQRRLGADLPEVADELHHVQGCECTGDGRVMDGRCLPLAG